eukprot:CAMPEP_0115875676 /NCGR_PEP_ID=MMETSP0287-20121206/25229_1 /TAXON_ID=412157 /ORGANISM="Chrysochromulina rotalis, Strain UIO044" /LENGTH=175 /DNA_ID=CAMNT_0003330965 /DNA_START=98 /DNA_END=622 /DNA_ORIENTATION=+
MSTPSSTSSSTCNASAPTASLPQKLGPDSRADSYRWVEQSNRSFVNESAVLKDKPQRIKCNCTSTNLSAEADTNFVHFLSTIAESIITGKENPNSWQPTVKRIALVRSRQQLTRPAIPEAQIKGQGRQRMDSLKLWQAEAGAVRDSHDLKRDASSAAATIGLLDAHIRIAGKGVR